jgi:Tfp pilus assembly protein PilF
MDKITLLSQILEQNPTDAFARYGLAMAYLSDGQTDNALAEFSTTIEHNPNYVPAYQMSAQTLIRLGRTAEARSRLHTGLSVAQQTGNTHAGSELQAMLDDLTL